MLLVEIALTVAAWRKGWGVRALMPMASAFGLAFFLGIVIGLGGGGPSSIRPLAVVLELLMMATLAHMSRTSPQPSGPGHPVMAEGQTAAAQS